MPPRLPAGPPPTSFRSSFRKPAGSLSSLANPTPRRLLERPASLSGSHDPVSLPQKKTGRVGAPTQPVSRFAPLEAWAIRLAPRGSKHLSAIEYPALSSPRHSYRTRREWPGSICSGEREPLRTDSTHRNEGTTDVVRETGGIMLNINITKLAQTQTTIDVQVTVTGIAQSPGISDIEITSFDLISLDSRSAKCPANLVYSLKGIPITSVPLYADAYECPVGVDQGQAVGVKTSARPFLRAE